MGVEMEPQSQGARVGERRMSITLRRALKSLVRDKQYQSRPRSSVSIEFESRRKEAGEASAAARSTYDGGGGCEEGGERGEIEGDGERQRRLWTRARRSEEAGEVGAAARSAVDGQRWKRERSVV
jgi:hypothetical protein